MAAPRTCTLSSCFNPSVPFVAQLVAAPRCALAPFVPQLPASFAISTMADTGGNSSSPFSPLSPWARRFLSPCPLVAGAASPSFDNDHIIEEALADPAFVEAATGAVSPSFNNNHIKEALSDPAFVEAVKSAEDTHQRKKKALPKYALDPNLPKVRQELIVDCFCHNVSSHCPQFTAIPFRQIHLHCQKLQRESLSTGLQVQAQLRMSWEMVFPNRLHYGLS